MTDVTQILGRIEAGDPRAAEHLLPLLYDELRKLAAAKLTDEKSGQTLQATALVHEAYIRLVDVEQVQHWNSRGHFFTAAAEAMRRILVDNARRTKSLKRGGAFVRHRLNEAAVAASDNVEQLLAVDEVLDNLRVEPLKHLEDDIDHTPAFYNDILQEIKDEGVDPGL
ncbi:MAG: ECF-type sigma factor, partial [Planctomycetaceae bacterium]